MIPVDWKSLFEPPHASVPRSGHATLSRNSRTVRIEWSDCDPAGIIFYPRYFEIFDAATAALLERALGMTKLEQLKHFAFAGYPLARTRAQFRRPTRYGDDVVVDSKVTFSRASFEIEHRLSLNGIVCVECSETRVWVVRDAATGGIKSHPVPEEVLEKFRT
jgi:4-hydroxybenzoyl-CoA thioesterase